MLCVVDTQDLDVLTEEVIRVCNDQCGLPRHVVMKFLSDCNRHCHNRDTSLGGGHPAHRSTLNPVYYDDMRWNLA